MNLLVRSLHLVPLLLALPAFAAQRPRDTAQAVATAVADVYYDAQRGARIADELRAAAQRGDFDTHADPRDLAAALSAALRPHDGHFQVTWTPAVPAEGAAPSPAVRRGPAPAGAVDPGIRRVQRLPGNLGLIDLAFFAGFEFDDDDAPARTAIDAALQLVAWSDAVIIDVRDNGGGAPAMVGYLTSAFTSKGADIYNTFHYREGTRTEAPEEFHPAPRLDVPVYVLISGRTASAAEAFAYTLKNAGRATIVGEASAGAANPGGFVPLGGGFAVFVSDGSPKSPITGRNWEGDGVVPDLEVPAAEALRAAQRHALERRRTGDADAATRWALDALRAEDAVAKGTSSAPDASLAGQYADQRVSFDGARLLMQQGRRPARALLPIPGSSDYIDPLEPIRRARFVRDGAGRAEAIELEFVDGEVRRFRHE